MWRNLIKTLERSLVLAPKELTNAGTTWNAQRKTVCCTLRSAATSSPIRNDIVRSKAQLTETTDGGDSHVEGDAEYIIPYKSEYEKVLSAETLIDTLRTRFRLSEADVEHIMSDDVVSKNYRKSSLLMNMEALLAEGVQKRNFVEYPWVITLDKKRVIEKIDLLKSLRGFRDINDFVPFLRIQTPRLRKVITRMRRESDDMGTYGNRVYYIAEKFQMPANVVTKYLAKRLFVLEIPLDMFKTNLQHLLEYQVDPLNILKDLWAFRYAPRAVEIRLKRVKSVKRDKIMPWMVRCPEPVLKKTLQITMDELEVMGSKTTVAEYVAERLGFTTEEAQAIMEMHPQVKSVRVTKIKEVLDYLLNEAKITRHEIARVPRILCHSLATTKTRMEELAEHGCRPSTLIIVCKSNREYQKFLKSWIKNYKPTKTVKSDEEIKNQDQV